MNPSAMESLFNEKIFGYENIELSPVAIGELPPAVCDAEYDSFNHPKFSLDSAVPACELGDLAPALVEFANRLYEKIPFQVNCAYRSVSWDRKKGRSGQSSHCKGLAMDIACINHNLRRRYIAALLELGCKRIGIAKTFIHFDLDPDKGPSIWLYYPDNVNKTF